MPSQDRGLSQVIGGKYLHEIATLGAEGMKV